MQKVMSVAAVLAVVVIGALVATHAGSSGSVFAAMIDRMNDIRTVRFEMQSEIKEAVKPFNLHATVTLAKPWSRYEVTALDQKVTRIMSSENDKMLTLFETLKTAQLGDRKGQPAELQANDVIETFRNMKNQGAEYLGKESVSGIEAMKYRLTVKGDRHTVWIDPATNLPVQMTVTDVTEPEATMDLVTFSNFQWDVTVDPSQLSLEVPAGYQVTPSDQK